MKLIKKTSKLSEEKRLEFTKALQEFNDKGHTLFIGDCETKIIFKEI